MLYATLPTQTPSGLPGHVNASFYPSTDRKTVRFETGYDSDWNRAAITAVASGLADSAAGLAGALGIAAFWEFLGAITDLDKRAEPEQPNHAATYLKALREVVPDLPVVDTIDGGCELPRTALLPAEQSSTTPPTRWPKPACPSSHDTFTVAYTRTTSTRRTRSAF